MKIKNSDLYKHEIDELDEEFIKPKFVEPSQARPVPVKIYKTRKYTKRLKKASDKQKKLLKKLKIPFKRNILAKEASALIESRLKEINKEHK